MQEYGGAAERSNAIWLAGTDWADKHQDDAALDVAGQQGRSRRLAHSHDGLAKARAASEAELRTVLHAAHCPASAQKAARFWATLHAPQLEASPPLVQAKARFALALVAQLEVLHQHLAEYDRAMGRRFRQHEDSSIFASVPGAGCRLAPRLFAEWGDERARYTGA